jgi:putative YhbY family RNA-binding protein
MKLEISPDERRALRAEAHHLTPVVMIGNDGLTPAVLHEIDVNLAAHGLIKIRVFSDDRGAREEFLSRIADELDAAPVQHIGKLLIVHRPMPEPEAAPRRKPAPASYLSRSGARRTTQRPGERAPASRQRKTEVAAPRGAQAGPRKCPAEAGSHAPGIPGRRRRRV